jgi:hypothetical protein
MRSVTVVERRDDDGAIAVIVGVMIITLLAFGAIVVDLGSAYQERRVLQNGADAAALAIARDCGTTGCADFTTTAQSLADDNADDAATNIEEICGSGTGMTACADPPAIPAGANYVRVKTKTEDADGGDKLHFGFARVLGVSDTTVHAHAIAVWGGPSSLTSSLPVTVSDCEFKAYTLDGTVLAPPPPYLAAAPYPTLPFLEKTIYFHDTTGANPCAESEGGSGYDLPGGFGWLATSSGCLATSTTGNWFADSTGRPPPNSCTWQLMAQEWKQVVAVPVFTQTNNLNGANGSYLVEKFAAFYLTGYSIAGQYKEKSVVTNTYPCSGQASCISGYFIDDSSLFTGTVGGASSGVTVVNLFE